MKHLNGQTTYKPLKENITHKLNNKLESLLKNGSLLKPWYKFYKPHIKHRTSNLYFLNKIHKNAMGIRPIVSSCDNITGKKIPIRRQMATTICEKSTFLPTHCKLTSIDEPSLYTNIPLEKRVQSALHLTNPDGYKCPEQPNPEILTELINIVPNLTKNSIYK